MKNLVNSYVEKFRHAKQTRRRVLSVIVALALVVSCGVYWELREDGLAMANATFCGMEEHLHGDECYEQVLTCGLEESEPTAGHTHDASCYDSGSKLVCGLEESPATAGHTHSDACYETVLVCDIPEHTHDITCLIDETADVESAADWEDTLPEELSGIWADDVVAIAESQLGYTESEANFQLAEDGETRQGYTRYGAWYGNEYGDWDAMFASFCLYYAGVPEDEFPEAAGAYAWTTDLKDIEDEDETGETVLLVDAEEYIPEPGDLVFFDTDMDGMADRVGILEAVETDAEDVDVNVAADAEMAAETGEVAGEITKSETEEIEGLADGMEESAVDINIEKLIVIEGDCEDMVKRVVYDYSSEETEDVEAVATIAAFGVLPEQPDIEVLEESDVNVDEEDESADIEEYAWSGNASGQVVLNLGNGNGNWNFADYTGRRDEGAMLRCTTDSLANYADDDGNLTINLPSDEDLPKTKEEKENFTVVDKTGDLDAVTVALEKEQAYDYTLVGWVNIATGEYYDVSDGATTADINLKNENVFYADWIAASYDCYGLDSDGSLRKDVVSTESFVDIEMFDYNELFNLYSASVEQDGTTSETWSDSGTLNSTLLGMGDNDETITSSFVFNNDGTTQSKSYGMLEYVNGRIAGNTWTNSPNESNPKGNIYVIDSEATWKINEPGDTILGLLFNEETSENVVGVNYIGDADYLFWIDDDGYYTYDSAESAAVYNQQTERFYVYNSPQYVTGKSRPCFLPFNSYSSSDETYSVYDGSIDYWFGMKMEVNFYLPTATGGDGNKVNGNDMVFNFSGDDDIWIFVDDTLVLDMAGIHDLAYGSIDFTAGTVTIGMSRDDKGVISTANGKTDKVSISAGNHTLTVYYMERGGYESNLEIQFNVVPLWEYETGPVQTVTAEKTWVDAQGNEIDPDELPDVYKNNGVEVGLFDVLSAPDSETDGMKYTVESDGTYTFDYTDDSGLEHIFAYDPQGNTLTYTEVENGVRSTSVVFSDVDEKGRVLDTYGNVVCWYENSTGLLHMRMDVQTLSAENDWYYAWELLDAEGEYEVLELSGSSSYTTSSTGEDLTSYYYWSVIGDKEIEDGLLDGKHPVILTEAAQEANSTLGDTSEAMGWVIVGQENGVITQQIKFSQIATLDEIYNDDGSVKNYLGTYGVTGQSEVESLGDGALWYMVDSQHQDEDVDGGKVEGFYLHCVLNGQNYYLTLTEDEHGLKLTTVEEEEVEFYYDSLGELMVEHSDGSAVRVEILADGSINIDEAESTAALDDVRIYTLQETTTSGFSFTAVNTFLPDITVQKVDSVTEEPLAGVCFTLTDESGKYYAGVDEESDMVVWYDPDDTGSETTFNPDEYTFNTAEDGTIIFNYLPDGTYTLTEIIEPDGYNPLPAAINITIETTEEDGVTIKFAWATEVDANIEDYVTLEEGTFIVTVENNPGMELPKTGGPGTLPFTVGGLVLILGAGGCLLYRKRRGGDAA